MFRLIADALGDHAAGIDGLNVFPTENHDTGSNLASAFEAIASTVEALPARCDLTTMASTLATASTALSSDRSVGRSGALLARLIGGFAEAMRNQDRLNALRFALALEVGVEDATHSLGRPVDGTIISVARDAAIAALASADADGSLVHVTAAAADAALESLERTPTQLAALADAGVVDAGAAGWVVVLEVIAARVSGDEPVDPDDENVDHSDEVPARYRVSMLVECDEGGARRLAAVWSSLGERVEVVTDDGVVSGSVDADDIGAVIEAVLAIGRPRNISVEDRRG